MKKTAISASLLLMLAACGGGGDDGGAMEGAQAFLDSFAHLTPTPPPDLSKINWDDLALPPIEREEPDIHTDEHGIEYIVAHPEASPPAGPVAGNPQAASDPKPPAPQTSPPQHPDVTWGPAIWHRPGYHMPSYRDSLARLRADAPIEKTSRDEYGLLARTWNTMRIMLANAAMQEELNKLADKTPGSQHGCTGGGGTITLIAAEPRTYRLEDCIPGYQKALSISGELSEYPATTTRPLIRSVLKDEQMLEMRGAIMGAPIYIHIRHADNMSGRQDDKSWESHLLGVDFLKQSGHNGHRLRHADFRASRNDDEPSVLTIQQLDASNVTVAIDASISMWPETRWHHDRGPIDGGVFVDFDRFTPVPHHPGDIEYEFVAGGGISLYNHSTPHTSLFHWSDENMREALEDYLH